VDKFLKNIVKIEKKQDDMSKVIGDLQDKVDKNLLAIESSEKDTNWRIDEVISCFKNETALLINNLDILKVFRITEDRDNWTKTISSGFKGGRLAPHLRTKNNRNCSIRSEKKLDTVSEDLHYVTQTLSEAKKDVAEEKDKEDRKNNII